MDDTGTNTNIFINDLDNGTEGMHPQQFAGDMKLEGMVATLDGYAAIQSHLDKQEIGKQEPHEVQQKEIQSPTLG